MSRINSQELFQLIKSLSQSEKRYFKLYASRHTIGRQNKYASLFDSIVRQDAYDEKDILREQKRFGKKQLPDLKSYLYRLILKALTAFHSDNSVSAQLKNIFRQTEILFEKGLYSQCTKLIHRAKQIAYHHELFHLLPEVFYWEKKIINAAAGGTHSLEKINHLYEEEKRTLETIQSDNDYWRVYGEMFFSSAKTGHLHSTTQRSKLKKILSRVSKSKPRTIESRINYFFTNEIFCFVLQDWKNLYKWCRKHLEMMESDKKIIGEKINPYIGLLNNLVAACLYFKKYDEALACILKIRHLHARSEYTRVRIFSRSFMLEFYLYTTIGEPEKALPAIPQLEEGLAKFKNKIPREHLLVLYHNTFYIFFMAGKFSDALRWLNKILNDTDSSREDLHSMARILNLIVHFEIGNLDMLPYAIQSSERFLSKRNRLYGLEKLMLKSFRKISRTEDTQRHKEIFSLLQKELSASADEPALKTAYEYFDFRNWLESKIQNRTFTETVREKSKQATVIQ
ncbi:MAG: hypothetical protein HY063_10415 [Bacteroidetes bacterium]|nr:hypothetical protein [Bacteroidota bacterium]